MFSLRSRIKTSLVGLAAMAVLLAPSHSLASTYGSGTYGKCAYSTGCPAASSSSGTPSTPTTTTAPAEEILLNDFPDYTSTTGELLGLSAGQTVFFNVADDNGGFQRYSVLVQSIGTDSVVLVITTSGAPITVTLHIGETKQFDVNADNQNDIQITLSSIAGGIANFIFKALSASIKSNTAPAGAPTSAIHHLSWWLWLILFLACLLFAIWFFILFWKRRRRNQDRSPPTITPPGPLA